MEVYKDWIDIFDEELSEYWSKFNGPKEMRSVSAMLFAIKREFKKITTELEDEVVDINHKISNKNILKPRKSTSLLFGGKLSTVRETLCTASPDLFKNTEECLKPDSLKSSSNSSTIISSSDDDNDYLTNIETSPILLKKRRKSPKQKENITPTRLDFEPPQRALTRLFNTPINITKDMPEDIDSFVIACTPEVPLNHSKKTVTKPKKMVVSKSGKKDSKNRTLTQMLVDSKKPHKDPVRNLYRNRRDFMNTTFLNSRDNEPDASRLSITEMVLSLNEQSQKASPKDHDVTVLNPEQSNCDNETNHINKQDLNDYLAVANNVEKNVLPGSAVRGNARKELPAWSCKECEKFYVNQGMTIEEIKQLSSKCSRHRGVVKPSDTVEGFWNITMSPMDSQY